MQWIGECSVCKFSDWKLMCFSTCAVSGTLQSAVWHRSVLLIGVPSLIPRGISTGVIETAKAWECYIRQEMCDSYRGRTRQYGHDKESKRGRERDREDCSFSYNRWFSMSDTYLVYLIFKSVSFDVSHWSSARHCMTPTFTCPSIHSLVPL